MYGYHYLWRFVGFGSWFKASTRLQAIGLGGFAFEFALVFVLALALTRAFEFAVVLIPIHPANADKSEGGGSSKHIIFDYFRLNRCRGCIPEVRGFLTD